MYVWTMVHHYFYDKNLSREGNMVIWDVFALEIYSTSSFLLCSIFIFEIWPDFVWFCTLKHVQDHVKQSHGLS